MSTEARYPDLAGKVAVVTGSSRGIGAATAVGLAANGAAVAVVGRDATAVDALTTRIEAGGGQAIGVVADCTDDAGVERLAATVAERLGTADILAAFVGGKGGPAPADGETSRHWRDVLDTNLVATFLAVQAFLPGMVEQGRGAIITMSSSAARQATTASAAYAAAKAGVIAYTRHLANEVAGSGVRVNCLSPSSVENDQMRKWMTREQLDELGATFPLRRLGQPDDVAAAALFLASDASSWITGTTLDISGGAVML